MLEVFFATNRGVRWEDGKPVFTKRFNERGPHELRYGAARVAKTRAGYSVKSISVARERLDAPRDSRWLGSGEIYETLRARMVADKIDVICLIHGFASTLEAAVERAAELKDKYRIKGREAHVFVFSWPADGEMVPFLDYYSDRKDAQASGVAMARALLKLRDFLIAVGRERHCQQSIHLVAHSMGAYALRWALLSVRGELGSALPRIFDNVFLMAADEDDDAFEHDHKLRLLPALARAVHVYFSPDDRALFVSDATKRNPDRLGSLGPRVRDGIPRKVILVDCRNVDVSPDDLTNHQYYRLNRTVVEDVNLVLSGATPGEMLARRYTPDDRSWRLDAADKPPRRRKSAPKAGLDAILAAAGT